MSLKSSGPLMARPRLAAGTDGPPPPPFRPEARGLCRQAQSPPFRPGGLGARAGRPMLPRPEESREPRTAERIRESVQARRMRAGTAAAGPAGSGSQEPLQQCVHLLLVQVLVVVEADLHARRPAAGGEAFDAA